jgi:multiple antibiotic resistance protein
MLEPALFAFVAFLVILDPPGTAAIFAAITAGASPADKRQQAVRATVISFIVLVGFAVAGGFLLRALGIGLPALKVAGGLLLFLAAADMVMGSTLLRSGPAEKDAAARPDSDISVFPLAIPLIAGPGAMTTIVLLAEQAAGDWLRLAAVVAAMTAALLLTLGAMLGAARLSRLLGERGGHVIGRVLGVVLAALAAQIALDGIRESFV